MNGLMTTSKRKAALFAAVLAVALVVVVAVVPFALGGGTAQKASAIVGVGETQTAFGSAQRQVESVAALENADFLASLDDENIEKLAEPTERTEIDFIDTVELEKAILEKQKAAKEAEEAAKAAKKAEEERRNAAIAAQKAKEAEEAKKKAEQAKLQAQKAKETAANVGTDWQNVVASVYHDVGDLLADGTTLGPDDAIIANKSLPLGTKVELEYNGKRCIATVRDRGPYVDGRDIDLAPGVQKQLGLYDGVTTVKMRLLG